MLREASGPVTADHLARAWNDPVQRDRALKALIADNLVEDVEDGRYALPS